jgi:hypothetical protein
MGDYPQTPDQFLWLAMCAQAYAHISTSQAIKIEKIAFDSQFLGNKHFRIKLQKNDLMY